MAKIMETGNSFKEPPCLLNYRLCTLSDHLLKLFFAQNLDA